MKRKIFLAFVILFVLFMKINVHAACTSEELRALKVEAQNITTQLTLKKGNPNAPDANPNEFIYYYDLTIYNLGDNFYSEIGNGDKNGELFIGHAYSGGGVKTNIVIYTSSKTKCPDTLVRKIYLSTPYYNRFSEYEECNGYENYDICKQDSNTEEVTEEQFKKEIKEIKRKKIEQQPVEEVEEKNYIERIIDFCKEHVLVIIPSIVAVIILIILLTIVKKRKKRNKVKIDLGDKI